MDPDPPDPYPGLHLSKCRKGHVYKYNIQIHVCLQNLSAICIPYLDPDQATQINAVLDPALFVSGFQDANKKYFYVF